MNKFVIATLALTAASSLSFAGSETKEWSSLDRDIESLAMNQGAAPSGLGVSGYVRSRYANSSDVDVDGNPATSDDLGGFNVDNARLVFEGSQGEYGVYISLDAASTGSADLLDAYATFHIAEGVKGQMGQFRAPFLWSSLIEENHLILLDRTFNGQANSSRDQGVQVSGTFDQFGWFAALQNGQDGVADEYVWTARVQFNALGGGTGMHEGAFGASDETTLTVGAAYRDDGTPNDGSAFCIDASFTQGLFSAHAELVDYEDDVSLSPNLATSTGVITPTGAVADAETPWSVTVGYMITPDQYEIVGRYEDIDDTNDSTAWAIGVNRYVSGHNAKWTLQYTSTDSDNAGIEADTLALGLTVGV